jgi:hypothetical protein
MCIKRNLGIYIIIVFILNITFLQREKFRSHEVPLSADFTAFNK